MTQPDLFTTAPGAPLTEADIQAWLADVYAGTYNATYFIHEPHLGRLTALLGEEVTPGPWKPAQITALFSRALQAARQEAQQ
jgi:hypothetical protein